MDYIREMQASDPAWASKDLQHCFYGLDADLIMLSLVTHEPNFRLLREKMSVRHVRKGRTPKARGQRGLASSARVGGRLGLLSPRTPHTTHYTPHNTHQPTGPARVRPLRL